MNAGVSRLDLKLGFRMLVKYPGLTLIGVFGLTLAIGLGAVWYQFTASLVDPSLPLEDADRMVAIRNFDLETAAPDPRALHDFVTWRDQLESVDELGAASLGEQTVMTEDGRTASAPGAHVTAAGLAMARVHPLLGRAILPEDERAEAPPVVVIGHDLWQRLFDGDRGAVGRTVRLGSSIATVVGVMPRGFGFPTNQEVWVPLRADPLAYERGEGPALMVFGRLAPGYSIEEAQAELTALGQRAAADFPASNARLRPRVENYLGPFTPDSSLILSVLNVPALLLLLVICANVATLVFARTVTRQGEIVTRSALGATRRRLVLQLFVEALALTSVSAAAGLAAAAASMKWGMSLFWQVQSSHPPFWIDDRLSLSTVLYTAALAVLSAALIGAVPALKATGRNLRPGLAGVSRLRFGRVSTAVIVVQVALCVIFLPIAFIRAQDALGDRIESVGFPAREYLSGRLTLQLDAPAAATSEPAREEFTARSAALRDEVRRRLGSQPGVTAVAFADRVPGMNHPYERIEVEDRVASADTLLQSAARALSVDLAFFEVMGSPIVAGRGFLPSDLESGARVVVVDESFAREQLAGRNPVGRRLRYPGREGEEAERWYEIVGVVQDLAMNAYGPGGFQDLVQTAPAGYVGVYHPLGPGEQPSVQLFLRTSSSNPDALVPAVQAAVGSLDPALAVSDLTRLDEVWRPVHRGERVATLVMALLALLVVGLSAAGIYALVSFTVSQRTREIGIRAALGADPRRIVITIFSRALLQLGLGVLVGGVLFGLLAGIRTVQGSTLVVAMGGVMLGVGLLACVLPARRALRIQPTEALRAEA